MNFNDIINKHNAKKEALIPILQDIQLEYGYVSEKNIKIIAKKLDVFPANIYGILTFYTQFHLKPRGKHLIKVCQGTACHVMGGKEILDHVSRKLNIDEGKTTKDKKYTLERVACLGCCGMAPVVVIDDNFYGRCTIQKVDKLLK